ncbi:hypothetical protein SCUP515_12797 [Seiridium cupressi]
MNKPRQDSVTVADVMVPISLVNAGSLNRANHLPAIDTQHTESQSTHPEMSPSQTNPSVMFEEPPTPHSVRFRKPSIAMKSPKATQIRFSSLISPSDHDKRESHKPPPEHNKRESHRSPKSLSVSFNKFGWQSLDSLDSSLDQDIELEEIPPPRRATRAKSLANNVRGRAHSVAQWARRATIADLYEKAKIRGAELERKQWVQTLFEYSIYVILLCIVYFALIGVPLWKGAVYWLYIVVKTKFAVTYGWSITIGIAFVYAFAPLLVLFEKEPPVIKQTNDSRIMAPGHNTALLIPCYKSETIIGPTLESAIKIFPPSQIFVIANGNSDTPLDNTEEVCRRYGVCHVWCNVGSKIVAQYVGCHKAKNFENVLMIDDDCALPPNFPIVSEQLQGKVKSIGYTIKSVGPGSSKGTYCQQAQDLEYKLSGLQRLFAGKIGSATFPHGAISLWNRKFLLETFDDHPGFSVSEDWFFGDSCRRLGGRIVMCSAIFVETETPEAIFFSSGSRGGFGEMTIFKQRFKRWNFFFVNGMYYNLKYLIISWRLGWWEIGAKLFVFQEIYETLLYLFTPFILPISLIVRPSFCGILLAGTCERISWSVVLLYYMPYKVILSIVNVASCYWSIWKYAKYFAKRHPKIIESADAVQAAMRVHQLEHIQKGPTEQPSSSSSNSSASSQSQSTEQGVPRVHKPSIYVASANRKESTLAGGTKLESIPQSPKRPRPTHSKASWSGVHTTDFAMPH